MLLVEGLTAFDGGSEFLGILLVEPLVDGVVEVREFVRGVLLGSAASTAILVLHI